MNRGDAAATWRFRGDESRRRHSSELDRPRRSDARGRKRPPGRMARLSTPRPRRGYSVETSRGDAWTLGPNRFTPQERKAKWLNHFAAVLGADASRPLYYSDFQAFAGLELSIDASRRRAGLAMGRGAAAEPPRSRRGLVRDRPPNHPHRSRGVAATRPRPAASSTTQAHRRPRGVRHPAGPQAVVGPHARDEGGGAPQGSGHQAHAVLDRHWLVGGRETFKRSYT